MPLESRLSMFSQTAEYALRAIVWLAENQKVDLMHGHREISKGTKVPESYLSKILKSLVEADLLISKRGAGGGFRISRDPSAISLLQVINAVDPLQRIRTCPLKLKAHKSHLCPVHAKIDETLAQVEQTLAQATIREVLYKPNFPKPLSEATDQPS